MPLLTLHPLDACKLCGCRMRGVMVGTFRINKNSLKCADRGAITATECPECGRTYARRHPTGVPQRCDRWILDAESQAVVDSFRARKGWAA